MQLETAIIDTHKSAPFLGLVCEAWHAHLAGEVVAGYSRIGGAVCVSVYKVPEATGNENQVIIRARRIPSLVVRDLVHGHFVLKTELYDDSVYWHSAIACTTFTQLEKEPGPNRVNARALGIRMCQRLSGGQAAP